MLITQRKFRIGCLYPVKVTEADGVRLFVKRGGLEGERTAIDVKSARVEAPFS
jgi:hypothetical protein